MIINNYTKFGKINLVPQTLTENPISGSTRSVTYEIQLCTYFWIRFFKFYKRSKRSTTQGNLFFPLSPKKWRQMSNYLPPLVSFQLQGLLCKPHFNSSFIPANTLFQIRNKMRFVFTIVLFTFLNRVWFWQVKCEKTPTYKIMLDSSTLFNINNKNNNFLTHFGTNIEHSVLRRSLWDMSIYHCDTTLCIVAPRYYYTLLMNHIEKSTIRKSDSLEFSQWNWQISVFDRLRLTWHMSVPDRKLAHIGRCGQHWAFVVVFLISSFEGHIWYFRGCD